MGPGAQRRALRRTARQASSAGLWRGTGVSGQAPQAPPSPSVVSLARAERCGRPPASAAGGPVPAPWMVTASTAGEGGKWYIIVLTLQLEYDTIHSFGKADRERGAPMSITRARLPCFHRRLRPLPMRERCPRLACRRGSRDPVTTGSQPARGRRSLTLLMDTAAVGRTQTGRGSQRVPTTGRRV